MSNPTAKAYYALRGGDFLYREIILAVIVSLDTFLIAWAYGNSGIKILFSSSLVINVSCSAVLWTALRFSDMLSCFIPLRLCRAVGMAVMTFIGLFTIIKSLVRILSGLLSRNGEMLLKMHNSGIILRLYFDDTAADTDNSKILSPKEASALAFASSLDSLATGISCGFALSPTVTAFSALAMGFVAVYAGSLAGKKFSSLRYDFSWVGGILIILFAFFGV